MEIIEFELHLFAQIMTIIFVGLYVIFAFVVIKQVHMMNETLEVDFEKVISALAYIHFLFAIVVFVLSFFIL